MKLTANRLVLWQAAKDASLAQNPKLPGVLLETHGRELWTTGFGSFGRIQRRVQDVETEEEGAAVLPSVGVEILAALPGETVSVSSDVSGITLTAGRSLFCLPARSDCDYQAGNYPLPENMVQMMGKNIRTMMQSILTAANAASEDAALGCVRLICTADHTSATATDGRKMAVSQIPNGSDGEIEVSLHSRPLGALLRLIRSKDELYFGIAGPYAVFAGQDLLVHILLSHKDGPTMDQMMQHYTPCYRAVLDARQLQNAVMSVAACLTPEDDSCIYIELTEGQALLSAKGSAGASKDTVEASEVVCTEGDGYYYNPRYLTDCLRALSGEIDLALDKTGVMLLTGKYNRYLIAPRGPAREKPRKKTTNGNKRRKAA